MSYIKRSSNLGANRNYKYFCVYIILSLLSINIYFLTCELDFITFQVTLTGYSYKLKILLETIIEKISSFEVKSDRFCVIKVILTFLFMLATTHSSCISWYLSLFVGIGHKRIWKLQIPEKKSNGVSSHARWWWWFCQPASTKLVVLVLKCFWFLLF